MASQWFLEFGKLLVWDATCIVIIARSYIVSTFSEAGAVAALAEEEKRGKYIGLDRNNSFIPGAVETIGLFWPQRCFFNMKFGQHRHEFSREEISHHYLLQRMLQF